MKSSANFKNAQRSNVAIDLDECNFGTCGVASSFQMNERLRVAYSINGATVYFPNNRLEELGPVAKRMAIELKAMLDGQMPNVEFDARSVIPAR
ncbi:hypothetical protein [Neorhizobium galegae]|uniref:hypothetical protein n=1 Tax=Neorhizobium galegae TaxID=399 RepID=UPI0012741813|nr:hypothetical protein [Neorhizobium galegae]KAA9383775.1 hypothetical protein F4V88_26120 [Neorhizobium galegae]MCM2500524.1 hypothetical protein [Neorhizobium galegae]MCQ1768185.1 hypothetical protein [Neorhizobium galegae]MCQ1770006.1 hypothetical protein [Neorhizobium galegae]MCQ1847157.1 hypothetical protein [Neorhizobium galegae]